MMRVLLLIVLLTAARGVTAEPGFLWSVDRAGFSRSYIFATLHARDPRLVSVPLASSLVTAGTRQIVTEIDIGGSGVPRAASPMTKREGPALLQLLPAAYRAPLTEALWRRRMKFAEVQSVQVWFLAQLLLQPMVDFSGRNYLSPQQSVALAFWADAKYGTPLAGLLGPNEGVEPWEQSADAQLAMLQSAIDLQGLMAARWAWLLSAYLEGDFERLDRTIRLVDRALELRTAETSWGRSLIGGIAQRDLVVERARIMMGGSNVLYLLDVDVLVGQRGLIARLTADGWTVTRGD